MSRKQVSEKTLELNITADLLESVRRCPLCQGVFWLGMNQRQEAVNGLDAVLHALPRASHLMLQFKSPASNCETRFFITTTQTLKLLRLSGHRPEAVYYVLPTLNRVAQMRLCCPRFLQRTWFLRVEDLRPLIGSAAKEKHIVDISTIGGAVVRSKLFRVELKTFEDLSRVFVSRGLLLSTTKVRSWYVEESRSLSDRQGPAGRFGTGLGTIVLS